MIKVSVVVTVYNGEKYLCECLNSIITQTLKELEIICIDDASVDATVAILKKYRECDSRIRIITNKTNCYAGTARNQGLKEACGKYIIFLDADDIFEADMLQTAYEKAEKGKADICIMKEDEFHTNVRKNIPYPYAHVFIKSLATRESFSPKEVKSILFSLWNGWAWDKLFRREFIINNKLYFQEMRTTNDAFFVHAALACAKKVTVVDQFFIHHRTHLSASLSNTRSLSWKCCFLYLSRLKAFLIEQSLFWEYEQSFHNWACEFLYWNYQTLDEANRKEMFYLLREFILDDLNLHISHGQDFFNAFHKYFIDRISTCQEYESANLPITEFDKYVRTYEENEEKIEKLFDYITKNSYSTGIWGAGDRGKAFLFVYGDKSFIKNIYDKDSNKKGQILEGGHAVGLFDEAASNQSQFILVTNASYYPETVEIVKEKNPDIKVFDLASYLSFPLRLEECML